MDPNPVYVLLVTFVPGCLVGTILCLAGIYFTHQKQIRSRELGADLITQMLNRKLSVEEIERLLLAWSQDPKLAKSMSKSDQLLGKAKTEPHFA